MIFTLRIDCDNAAFGDSDNDRSQEIERILKDVARIHLFWPNEPITLIDLKGNRVGECQLTEEKEQPQ